MFATRNDQENLVHNHQQAAASKPLNQGLKSYGAKTPAPKTPFRIPLNDENAAGAGKALLKTNGKGKEAGPLGGKKGGELERNNAFVTPAGPRNRAPLGMKTTNAKAKAFQTPAPLTIDNNKAEKTVLKTVSPRLRKPKVKIHQPEPVAQDVETDSEPEIEFMPPKEVPLPDYPESDTESESYFGPNKTYPMLEGENFTRGIGQVYLDPVDEHGERLSEKRERLALEKYQAEQEEEFKKEVEKERVEEEVRMRAELGMSPPKSVLKQTAVAPPAGQILVHASKAKSNPTTAGTISSRSAAAALAAPTKASTARRPAPTTAPAAKTSTVLGAKSRNPLASKNSNAKNAAAVTASKSTVGYSKGRAMSSTMRGADTAKRSAGKAPLAAKAGAKGDKENDMAAKPKAARVPPSLASFGLGDGVADDDDLGGNFDGRPPLFDDDEDLFQFKLDG